MSGGEQPEKTATGKIVRQLIDLDGGAKVQLATLIAIIISASGAAVWASTMHRTVTRLEQAQKEARVEERRRSDRQAEVMELLRSEWVEFRASVIADYGARLRVIETRTNALEKRVDDHQDGHPGRVEEKVEALRQRVNRIEDRNK